jgi:hypothetical protein
VSGTDFEFRISNFEFIDAVESHPGSGSVLPTVVLVGRLRGGFRIEYSLPDDRQRSQSTRSLPAVQIRISNFEFRIYTRGDSLGLELVARDSAGEIRIPKCPPHPVGAPKRGQYTSGPLVALHRVDKFEIRNSKFEIFFIAYGMLPCR